MSHCGDIRINFFKFFIVGKSRFYSKNVFDNIDTSRLCYKTFLRKSGKSRFPPKLKQQVQTILKVKNSFRV